MEKTVFSLLFISEHNTCRETGRATITGYPNKNVGVVTKLILFYDVWIGLGPIIRSLLPHNDQ